MKSILSETLLVNVKRGDRKNKVQNICKTDFKWQLPFLLFIYINLFIYIYFNLFINLEELQRIILNIYIIFILKTRYNIILVSILTGI